MKRVSIAVLLPLLAVALAAVMPSAALAQRAPIDCQELDTFIDYFFTSQMNELHIPGAVIMVVQDGQVLATKGYGYANLEHQIPVNPEETAFRIGSVSKLFVATAIMQLVEQGRLNLHADINQYLTTFKVPRSYLQPITIAHLLTHSAGFDTPYYDFSFTPAKVLPLERYLRENTPTRIRPPGEVLSYSNYGYTLLGHIVAQVSGMSFEQYVAENILKPLGMGHSRYFYKPPAPEGLALGYSLLTGERAHQPPDYDSEYPAGALVSTATDMARFMLAHLHGGCYADACVMKPTTVAEMQRQQYADHPQLTGWTFGFMEGSLNGQRLIGHSGSTLGYGNILELLPEHQVGYFISFNLECLGSSACQIISRFRNQFLDRFFPGKPKDDPFSLPKTDMKRFVGYYRHVWYPHSTVHKIRVLEQDDLEVKAGENGLIINKTEYAEIAPLLFQKVGGEERIAFREDGKGRIVLLFRPTAYEKLAWYQTAGFSNFLFDLWGWLWGGIALAWLLTLAMRRWRKQPPFTSLVGKACWLLVIIAGLNAAFMTSLIRLFWVSRTTMTVMLSLLLVAAFLSGGMLILAGIMWWRRLGTLIGRVGYSLIVMLMAAFLWFLNYWNLVGFRFG